jgi:hypothetical protein
MIYEYFKKEFKDFKIIVQLNPKSFEGIELTIYNDKSIEKREMQFDKDIYEDFEADAFKKANPLEFNLYLNGITD